MMSLPIMKKSEGKNWYSGEVVKDLVDKVGTPDQITGDTQQDSNYEDELYSEEQLKRHEEMDNIFKVDGVPSRWEHNKLRSTWHFDPFGDSQEQTFVVPCRFVGDFQPAIDYAIANAREYTIGNYRSRNKSKQDADMHDGEILDAVNASGKEDVSCMYHDRVVRKQFTDSGEWKIQKNSIPEYEILFNVIRELDVDVHQSRLHIQRLGQVTPIHIDNQMRYARPGWRDVWLNAGADKQPLKLRRFLIHLQDWTQGHVWQFGNTYQQGYKAGTCTTYDWCNMPHGTANFSFTPRITFQITGFVGDKCQWMIDNPDPNRIIEV
jgi:hypothetical protein